MRRRNKKKLRIAHETKIVFSSLKHLLWESFSSDSSPSQIPPIDCYQDSSSPRRNFDAHDNEISNFPDKIFNYGNTHDLSLSKVTRLDLKFKCKSVGHTMKKWNYKKTRQERHRSALINNWSIKSILKSPSIFLIFFLRLLLLDLANRVSDPKPTQSYRKKKWTNILLHSSLKASNFTIDNICGIVDTQF